MKLRPYVHLLASGSGGFDWTDACDCNVYLVNGGSACALIDTGAGGSTESILRHAREDGIDPSRIRHIVLTHFHADHAGGAAALREATGAGVAGHHEGKAVLETADETAIDLDRARACGFYPPDYRLRPCPMDLPLEDGAVIPVGSLTLRVLAAPGHSRFDLHILVESPDGHVSLFTGDSLFPGGRISMLSTRDFDLQALGGSLRRLRHERVDSLFAGHLQPALCRGATHVETACRHFDQLRVPPSIV